MYLFCTKNRLKKWLNLKKMQGKRGFMATVPHNLNMPDERNKRA